MRIPLSIGNIIIQNINNVSNLYLLLTKYVGCWYYNDRNNNWDYEKEERDGNTGKSGWFKKCIQYTTDQNKTGFYSNFFSRWKQFIKSQSATTLTAKVEWRLVIGLGSGSVLETSMTLHHILGVPYIPGSAVKGVLSSYYLIKNENDLKNKIDQKNTELEQQGIQNRYQKENLSDLETFAMNEDETYIKIFGNENQKGKVIFFDAYPTTFPQLELDIMNPHYDKYYDTKGEQPPADYITPVPIKFLTVKKDTEFIFAFKSEDVSLNNTVIQFLKEALSDIGIGAKTAVGYGYFNKFTDLQL